MPLSIYCVRPISGRLVKEMFEYYDSVVPELRKYGYRVFHPAMNKEWLRRFSGNANPKGYNHSTTNGKAIFGRDYWMVRQSDIVYADLTDAKIPSIGSCFELAWAHELGKHVVVAMEDDNVHQHVFVNAAADIVFNTPEKALIYLREFRKELNGAR